MIKALTLAIVMMTGCLPPADVHCGANVCPVGRVCSATGGCVVPEQLSTCDGKPDGGDCSYPGVASGACRAGLCVPAGCGNGVREPDELCDDGDNEPRDGCSADCRSTESCGNGVIDGLVGESCDDGNLVDGDGCQATCLVPTCGDGVIDSQFNEACDKGALNSNAVNAVCRPNCQPRRCSDGIIDTIDGEVCDDANASSGDGCSFDCRSAETCGNDITDFAAGELCDEGTARTHDGCTSGCMPERATWSRIASALPALRIDHAMAFDAARGETVVFGGAFGSSTQRREDTWVWNGRAWRDKTPIQGAAPARSNHAMAYDARRSRIVLFGGADAGGARNDTWEWNGTGWAQRNPAVSPASRTNHEMVYDAGRDRVVLFGGNSGSTWRGDTWEWDGAAGTWTQLTPAAGSPPKRTLFAMAYDPGRSRVVLFGGYDENGMSIGDTWEWDGATWTNPMPANAPSARYGHAMAYDSVLGKVVLFGGYGGTTDSNGDPIEDFLGDMYAWNGTDWNIVSASTSPPPVLRHSMTTDAARGRVVLYGGAAWNGSDVGLWEWDGAVWMKLQSPSGPPSARTDHAIAYDPLRGRTVLFGGLDGNTATNQTYEFDGVQWTIVPASNPPPARSGHCAFYDPSRARVIVSGGFNGATPLDDTWEFDGVSWTDITPAAPRLAGGCVATYDTARARAVAVQSTTTWEWNGTWTKLTPSATPSPESGRSIAYDPSRARTVLFGGVDSTGPKNDTWEWDGTTWTPIAPLNTPPPRALAALAYEPVRKRVVMFGGISFSTTRNDAWEYDGTSWTEITPADSPPPRIATAMTFDATSGCMLLFSGSDGTTDTWCLRHQANGAAEDGCHGLDGDSDGTLGCADPDCWSTCTPTCLPDMTCTAGERCGDSICNPALESCRLCPECGPCPVRCGDFFCDVGETTTCPSDCH